MKINSIPKLLDTIFKEHSTIMHPYVLKFFTYTETLTYILACLCVLLGFAISLSDNQYFQPYLVIKYPL